MSDIVERMQFAIDMPGFSDEGLGIAIHAMWPELLAEIERLQAEVDECMSKLRIEWAENERLQQDLNTMMTSRLEQEGIYREQIERLQAALRDIRHTLVFDHDTDDALAAIDAAFARKGEI